MPPKGATNPQVTVTLATWCPAQGPLLEAEIDSVLLSVTLAHQENSPWGPSKEESGGQKRQGGIPEGGHQGASDRRLPTAREPPGFWVLSTQDGAGLAGGLRRHGDALQLQGEQAQGGP